MKITELVGEITVLTEIYDGVFSSLHWHIERGVVVGNALIER